MEAAYWLLTLTQSRSNLLATNIRSTTWQDTVVWSPPPQCYLIQHLQMEVSTLKFNKCSSTNISSNFSSDCACSLHTNIFTP